MSKTKLRKGEFINLDVEEKIGDRERMAYPPETIRYNNLELMLLGRSTSDDLLPANIEDSELLDIVMTGDIAQYIYTDEKGNLYDALVYINKVEEIMLKSIRTRIIVNGNK